MSSDLPEVAGPTTASSWIMPGSQDRAEMGAMAEALAADGRNEKVDWGGPVMRT